MIARFTAIAIEPELDRAWFADHRRQYRWRPCQSNEAGMSVIVNRDGQALTIPVAPAPGLCGAGDDVLSALFTAYSSLRNKEAERSATPGPV